MSVLYTYMSFVTPIHIGSYIRRTEYTSEALHEECFARRGALGYGVKRIRTVKVLRE